MRKIHHLTDVPPAERHTVTVNGYHTTASANLESILENGFRMSKNKEDWLGDGVYFWQDAPHRAWDFAREPRQRQRLGEDPVVIGVQILLPLNASIDLFDSRWITRLRRKRHQLISAMYTSGSKMEEIEKFYRQSTDIESPKPRHTDRLVMNELIKELAIRDGLMIKAVRASFPEGRNIYSESGYRMKSHVQLAIRDLDLIDPKDDYGASIGLWLEPEPTRD